MPAAPLRTWWMPSLLALLAADVNFWIFAAIGNAGDYVGIAFFAFFGIYSLRGLIARREGVIAGTMIALGSAVAIGAMVLRETEVFDRGYIPPYLVFIGFVLLGKLIDRRGRAAA